ncbi:30S ribosomal protein S11 [Smittium culicis]|uniref:30S ribosomal protein S11 n=1 Tax=Smittium culicis TaxID=133412 RepID=A0A1R1XDE7_9FUNG|nr:30S ribosomal protein S11 [Smittium culicis]
MLLNRVSLLFSKRPQGLLQLSKSISPKFFSSNTAPLKTEKVDSNTNSPQNDSNTKQTTASFEAFSENLSSLNPKPSSSESNPSTSDSSASTLNSSSSTRPQFGNFNSNSNSFSRDKAAYTRAQSHVLHVKASSNNTLLSLTNLNGDVLVASSGGCQTGFKKAGRAGHEAAYQATVKLFEKATSKNINITGIELKFKGLGPGREACFKALRSVTEWPILRITDVTPIPFNGCRPRKARRL